MSAAIVWKEYRQQRAIWLAVTILAIGLVEVLIAALGSTTDWQHSTETQITVVMLIAAASFGIFSGACVLASEKEDGTLDLLSGLTGRDGVIWRSKLVAGLILTFTQSLVLAAYVVSREIGLPGGLMYIPALGLVALAWGLLGGALCGHILTAALTAAPLMAISLALAIPFSGTPLALLVSGIVGPLTAMLVSRRVFCRDDFSRTRLAADRDQQLRLRLFSSCFAVFWLIYRQSRWALIAVAGAAPLLAGLASVAPLLVWPVGSLVLGMACGLAAFTPDQRSGHIFWGNQRFPRGRIWLAKVLAWAVVLALLLTVSWALLVTSAIPPADAITPRASDSKLQSAGLFDASPWLLHWVGEGVQPERSLNGAQFLILWPIYGFCIALFLGQMSPRPIMALVLTILIAPLATALWLPSYLVGNLFLWQILTVPLALLLTSRLAVRPWASGRLWTFRPMSRVILAGFLMACWLVFCLWYRVIQVPDVGTPFEVSAHPATRSTTENNKSGPTIQDALRDLHDNFTDENKNLRLSKALLDGIGADVPELRPGHEIGYALGRFAEQGNWSTKEEEPLGKWLDALFAERWWADLQRASRLPVSIDRDLGAGALSRRLSGFDYLANLLYVRSLQLEFRGDFRGALELFEVQLGVARQLKSNRGTALVFGLGSQLEQMVMRNCFVAWLRGVGNDKGLLESAAEVLRAHAAADPDPANAVIARYAAAQSTYPFGQLDRTPLDLKYRPLAALAPWEKARLHRVFKAMTLAALISVKQARQPWAVSHQPQSTDLVLRVAQLAGLPLPDGPTTELNASEWGALILESWPVYESGYEVIKWGVSVNAFAFRGAEIAVAMRRYLADHGRLPKQPQDLLPAYLAELPKDSNGNIACRFDVEETETALVPVMLGRVLGAGVTLGPSSYRVAFALTEMSQRVPFPVLEEGFTGGAAGSSPEEGPAGLAGAPPMAAPGDVAESAPLPILVPRAVIDLGDVPWANMQYRYPVPLPLNR
jgi:hypothetical protein